MIYPEPFAARLGGLIPRQPEALDHSLRRSDNQ